MQGGGGQYALGMILGVCKY